ncbi:MAG: ammonium transporter [Cohaesibacter sp.]|jgi:ammonia channel protein AmtB|nr:ammonium transporter [Cohaesibacter sp.]
MLDLLQFFMSITGIAIPLGLLLIMAGRVRYRNELDTLVRIISAFGITIAAFWLIGHSLFASPSLWGVIGLGWGAFGEAGEHITTSDSLRTIFLFVLPAIVVACALSERGTLVGNNFLVAIVSALIIPLAAHWGWKNDYQTQGWLVSRGFLDVGGAVIFFASAGFAGLAASVVVGPRLMRFPNQASRPRGHSPTFTLLGVMIVIIGLAIMTASREEIVQQMSATFLNVVIGSTFAGAAALALMVLQPERVTAMDLINSSLAGGIALVAFAGKTSPASAALVGMFAGSVAIGLRNMLETLEVDDPGDLISITLGGGLVGGAIAPIMVASDGSNLLYTITLQLLGITVIGLWVFSAVWACAKILHQTVGLRVSEADEIRGLSLSHFRIQSEPDYVVSFMAHHSDMGKVSQKDLGEELDRISGEIGAKVVQLRNETRRAISRIQASSQDSKVGAAMAARMRMSDDSLRVNTEDLLLMLERILSREGTARYSQNLRDWAVRAIDLLLSPTLNDLEQYARHMPLQAELEELEAMVIGSADVVARCTHQIKLVGDFCDAGIDGFFGRDHHCDFSGLLEQQAPILQAAADVRNLPIQIDNHKAEGLYATGDSNAFKRIITLTAEGAFNRAVHGRSDPLRLELREHIGGEHLIFECLDTGTALTSRQVRAIIDPVAASDMLGDIGLPQILPLMLVTRLVEALGGDFTLSSEQGLGTLMQCRFHKMQTAQKASKAA